MSLKNYWYIAAESRELKKRPIARTIFGEKIVLFRDARREAGALLDRCAHRNMALSLGRVVQDCVECPYHGWRYDRTGKCLAVPSMGDNPKLPGATVKSFPVLEQDGYIWIFPGDQFNNDKPFHFPHYGETGWTSFKMKTRFLSTVEACLENFLDCPHTVFVHKGWFRSHHTQSLSAVVRRRPDSVEVEFKEEPISDSVVSRLLFPKSKQLKHTDRFLMPNLSRVDYDFGPERHFIVTSQCTPYSDEETEVYTTISYRFGRLGLLVRLFFEPLCRHIIAQDVDILREHSKQMKQFGGPEYAHVETDLLGLHIQSLRTNRERNKPPPEDSQRVITITF
jgi:phenylpropionate dioxygenase-like ring-hydroxylating dioxygenase large terminal subunit